MQIKKIINKNSQNVILFFCGFGLDENPFLFLKNNYDVYVIYDYSDLDNISEIKNLFIKYDKINIISFSLGVWVYAFSDLPTPKISKAVMINGSFRPIDKDFGIQPRLYKLTERLFTIQNREKFYNNLFDSDSEYNIFMKTKPQRLVESQKKELLILEKHITNTTLESKVTKVIISENDKIFPPQNLKNYWSSSLKLQNPHIIKKGHFPFYYWKNWEDIL